jgi:Putative zinc-finger
MAGADVHAGGDLLARYAAGAVETVELWSVEAHLTGCARCRSVLSAHVDADRLARNRSTLLARAALPETGWARRLLCRLGVPDYLLRLLAATPSLRRSWLLSVVCVLAVVAGEAAAVGHSWMAGSPLGLGAHTDPAAVVPFLVIAPLLVLAGVTAAFLPMFDPAYRLAVAAPFPAFTLLLVRTVSALAAALVPVVAAAFVLPGPGWLPAALLLPSLALSALTLAAATVLDPRAAAVLAAVLWALAALLPATAHVPLLIAHPRAQVTCAVVLCVSAGVLLVRHNRFEVGWIR